MRWDRGDLYFGIVWIEIDGMDAAACLSWKLLRLATKQAT